MRIRAGIFFPQTIELIKKQIQGYPPLSIDSQTVPLAPQLLHTLSLITNTLNLNHVLFIEEEELSANAPSSSGLVECMKSMLMHSFVLDALDTTGADTFSHFEMLIDEHREMTNQLLQEINSNPNIQTSSQKSINVNSALQPMPNMVVPSRLKQLVPSIGTFYTRLPLRKAFEAYNLKYGITKRRYICISFNEIRHIMNLAQIIAMITPYSEGDLNDDNMEGVHIPRTTWLGLSMNGSNGNGMGKRCERQSEEDSRVLEAWAEMRDTPRRDDSDYAASSDDSNNEKEADKDKNKEQEQSSSPSRDPVQRRDRSDSCNIEQTLSLLPTSSTLPGPKLVCFDGDQTLYSDGANFESNPKLAKYLYLLLKHGVTIAVVTAAGYEYQTPKYELRLSGLLAYFKYRGLELEDRERFYIFGGECNYLMRLGNDYKLHAVREDGPGGWLNSTKHLSESPGNWSDDEVASILDRAEACFASSLKDQNMRASIIRKKRSVGMIPRANEKIPREALDETVLRIQTELDESKVILPFCAFNGGRDAWVDVGNKRVGVQVLQSYLGITAEQTLHIGDQFLNTGNDFAARSVCPCVWITSPEETSYILKSILRLGGVPLMALMNPTAEEKDANGQMEEKAEKKVDFEEAGRRTSRVMMDVYTGEFIGR